MASTYEEITEAQTDAKSPINEDLIQGDEGTETGGVRHNFINLDARTTALEGAGGGGGATAGVAQILSGGETNEGILWRKRHAYWGNIIATVDSDNIEGEDFLGSNNNYRFIFNPNSDENWANFNDNSWEYGAKFYGLAKDKEYSFKIKKGENFFSLNKSSRSDGSDSITVTIDGLSITSFGGIVDENETAKSDTYSSNNATSFIHEQEFFFGLDGEEHIVTVKNTDSATKIAYGSWVDIGFKENNPTIDNKVKIKTGTASVRGSLVSFAETELTFTEAVKGKANGHTGAIVSNQAGALSALDGESPAQTQVKSEEAIAFTGVVTSLPAKNNWFFPDSGMLLVSMPNGNTHIASYNTKTDTTIQAHTFNNTIFKSQPSSDYTPNNWTVGSAGSGRGDINLNYFGTAPILIDTTNNKIDFKIKENGGSLTTYVATVDSGRYSGDADLVYLGKAIVDALNSAKSINGSYSASYSADSQLWIISINSTEVEEFELLFNSGANVANSIHTTIGYPSTDTSAALSYSGTTEVQHLSTRVFEKGDYFFTEDPRIKYSWTYVTPTATYLDEANDAINRLGFPTARNYSISTVRTIEIYPDDDTNAISTSFLTGWGMGMLTYQVDNGQFLYLAQTDSGITNSTIHPLRAKIINTFISFPKGTHQITIRFEVKPEWFFGTANQVWTFLGFRQWHTKPALEKLTLSESILKTFEVSALSLNITEYGNTASTLYAPQASDDQINTLAENGGGSWVSTSWSQFNAWSRDTFASGDYVEVDFTLVGDGGGIGFRSIARIADGTRKAALFISSTTINEATDRVQNNYLRPADSGNTYQRQMEFIFLGLPAGTYKARIKNEDANRLVHQGIAIFDTVHPQEDASNVADINNTGQSVAYPYNVYKKLFLDDNNFRVPKSLFRSGFREGILDNVYVKKTSQVNNSNYDDTDTTNVSLFNDRYFGAYGHTENNANNFYGAFDFCKAMSIAVLCETSLSIGNQPFIDGVSTSGVLNQRTMTKNGTAPGGSQYTVGNLFQKEFKLSCSFSAGDTFTLGNTRGILNDRTVILYDGTNYEKAVINSFVVGTSFTLKKARSVVTDANVTHVLFYGFHNIKLLNQVTGTTSINTFNFEPLTIRESNYISRLFSETELETKTVTFRDVVNNDDLYYPRFSDGSEGNFSNSSIQVIKSSGGTYSFPTDLENVQTSLAIDVKITSIKKVRKIKGFIDA